MKRIAACAPVLPCLLLTLAAGVASARAETDGGVAWRELAPGLDLAEVALGADENGERRRATVVRADPRRFELVLVGCDADGEPRPRSARRWAESERLVLATNAGMFATDHRTHLGLLETAGEVRARAVSDYQSVAAFDPRDPQRSPPFAIFDLDASGITIEAIRRDYGSLLQNLRLIKKPGENRWSRQPKRWSEAALGEDAEGRVLFVHARAPFSMHDLNRELLAAGIGLVAAQHLEGGPEAQLYLSVGDTELELVGSFETGFLENEGNTVAWPVPHVIGLRARR